MTDVEVAGVDVCLVSSQWTEILIIDVKKLGEVAIGRNKNEGIKLVIDVDETIDTKREDGRADEDDGDDEVDT